MPTLTSEERHTFARELIIVARRWRTRLDERLRPLGVSQSRWSVLYWLSEAPEGINQTELAERVGIEPAALVRVLDLLERQALVERTICPRDRRVKIVHLLPSAAPLIADIARIGDELRAEVMAEISNSDFRVALQVLKEIRHQLDGDEAGDAQTEPGDQRAA